MKAERKTSVNIRKKSLTDGMRRLYLDIYFNGKRSYEFLDFAIYAKPRTAIQRKHNVEVTEAVEEIRSFRLLSLQKSKHNQIPNYRKNGCFITYMETLAEARVGKTREIWKIAILHLNRFLVAKSTKSTLTFQEITKTFLEEFRNHLLTLVAVNSVVGYFSKINAALKQAVRDELIVSNPAAKLAPLKRTRTLAGYLTVDELQILSDCKTQNIGIKTAFLFSCFTGLRLSDIQSLQWHQVDEKNGLLRVIQIKTGEPLEISLSCSATEILKEINTEKDGLVFELPCRQRINFGLKRWFKQAGIPKRAHFHLARHTFASLLVNSGANIYVTGKLLGHLDSRSTQIYSHLYNSTTREAIQNLPVIVKR